MRQLDELRNGGPTMRQRLNHMKDFVVSKANQFKQHYPILSSLALMVTAGVLTEMVMQVGLGMRRLDSTAALSEDLRQSLNVGDTGTVNNEYFKVDPDMAGLGTTLLQDEAAGTTFTILDNSGTDFWKVSLDSGVEGFLYVKNIVNPLGHNGVLGYMWDYLDSVPILGTFKSPVNFVGSYFLDKNTIGQYIESQYLYPYVAQKLHDILPLKNYLLSRLAQVLHYNPAEAEKHRQRVGHSLFYASTMSDFMMSIAGFGLDVVMQDVARGGMGVSRSIYTGEFGTAFQDSLEPLLQAGLHPLTALTAFADNLRTTVGNSANTVTPGSTDSLDAVKSSMDDTVAQQQRGPDEFEAVRSKWDEQIRLKAEAAAEAQRQAQLQAEAAAAARAQANEELLTNLERARTQLRRATNTVQGHIASLQEAQRSLLNLQNYNQVQFLQDNKYTFQENYASSQIMSDITTRRLEVNEELDKWTTVAATLPSDLDLAVMSHAIANDMHGDYSKYHTTVDAVLSSGEVLSQTAKTTAQVQTQVRQSLDTISSKLSRLYETSRQRLEDEEAARVKQAQMQKEFAALREQWDDKLQTRQDTTEYLNDLFYNKPSQFFNLANILSSKMVRMLDTMNPLKVSNKLNALRSKLKEYEKTRDITLLTQTELQQLQEGFDETIVDNVRDSNGNRNQDAENFMRNCLLDPSGEACNMNSAEQINEMKFYTHSKVRNFALRSSAYASMAAFLPLTPLAAAIGE